MTVDRSRGGRFLGALSAIPCPRHTPTRRQDRRCEGQRAAIDWLIFTMPLCTRFSPEGIPMTDHDDTLAYYAMHSPFSDPGTQSPMLDSLPADIAVLRDAVTPLVFHYMGDGDWAENGIAPERRPEIDLRYAERMFGRLAELSDKPLGEHRPPHERMVGCCRDFTLLYVSLLRHHSIPARSRVGFAGYFFAEWNVDHVVAEVWDANEGRWRLVDPELGGTHVDPTDGAELDAMDLPRDRFFVGPEAWLRCR